MSAQTKKAPVVVDHNEVRLVGRVSQPEVRELPSGDALVVFRVVVTRASSTEGATKVDALDCVAWTPRSRRSATSWRAGDVVEVTGALRRRFFTTGAGRASRTEVEMSRGRVVRRARTG